MVVIINVGKTVRGNCFTCIFLGVFDPKKITIISIKSFNDQNVIMTGEAPEGRSDKTKPG